MATVSGVTPRTDLAAYLTSYPAEMALGKEEPATVVDRYHTPDIEWYSDGLHLDRDKLIAHARPARKNATSVRCEVHEALVAGDQVAARHTLHAVMRKGRSVVTEIYMFGRLAPDGRLRRVDQITRILPTAE